MRIFLTACVLSVMLPSAGLRAQTIPSPGDRVRVSRCSPPGARTPDLCARYEGTLVALSARDVRLRVEGWTDEVTMALDSTTTLDVYAGRRARPARGAVIGFAAGAATGLLVGIAMADDEECDALGLTAPCHATLGGVGAAVLGATGALLGAVAGALVKTDRWEEAPLGRVGLIAGSSRSGAVVLGASVRF